MHAMLQIAGFCRVNAIDNTLYMCGAMARTWSHQCQSFQFLNVYMQYVCFDISKSPHFALVTTSAGKYSTSTMMSSSNHAAHWSARQLDMSTATSWHFQTTVEATYICMQLCQHRTGSRDSGLSTVTGMEGLWWVSGKTLQAQWHNSVPMQCASVGKSQSECYIPHELNKLSSAHV